MMQFQDRDEQILNAIYNNDGVLAKRHLKALFWPGKSWRAMERRLSKLYHNAYIAWPDRQHFRNYPIPEPVCWLDWKGALIISGRRGIPISPPKRENENQMRLLHKRLRDSGIRWVREPRWSMLRHDLAVVDFRLAINRSIHRIASMTLENWQSESEFRSDMDVVEFTTKTRRGKVVNIKRGVCPDAYFEIIDETRRLAGKPHRARFLLEIDMGTHDNPSFGREKAAPGAAYIKSQAYKTRFGHNSGRWLIVTAGGERRLGNLIQQTGESAGREARLFFFSNFDALNSGDILTSPIWWQAGASEPKPLLS
jgi:hypothetical protein